MWASFEIGTDEKVKNDLYDSLFDSLFIIISVTMAPFFANLMQSPIYRYKMWTTFSFVAPILATVIIWAYAIFRDSVQIRIIGWFSLVYQITRTPFVIYAQLVGLENLKKTIVPVGPIFIPVGPIFEFLASIGVGFLIAKRYNSLLESKTNIFDWLPLPVFAVLLLALFEAVVSFILSR